MKPEYSNWVPDKLKKEMLLATVAFAILAVLCGLFVPGTLKVILVVILIAASIVCGWFTWWCYTAYNAFSYDGDIQLSRKIVEGTADFVHVPDDGACLDVGCGSGALTIAVAKKNPRAYIVGCDRWGKEYSNFSRKLCEKNAAAEGVANVRFQHGDATKLPFPDESFDAVTSNYVYHNITEHNKQKLLLETLRVLKKGGTFVIHDLMSKSKYGDMDAFVRKLKDMGYEEVRLIDTTDSRFMTKKQASKYMLQGSTILCGRK
ncbi:MAG: methyltransferase domain-containing protein [Lachnospiraceae bacterium]|jgi:ubiquinone/menaquinone biosynthesis C-methylase UbiE|nr:methyltransferase domain-containing protein [Lachnospiraceae bacterium]MCH4030898.1 methyltransferase domain-containing protein [Lachnospiraceae bacterium]MCH4070871.1 methyltransferase domain-containing protein [Lachnospiraceae bacterium]MCI1362301.1 methyltransferase domain-containing protein [Lachnospiraceae bacterium]MCI1402653.1 methyltransferase domain-containing protein [Lachnospiraceae bacterium]